jgi:uncharacterized membrane protein YqiK
MGFRDDDEAQRARADALERENRDLRRELEALKHPSKGAEQPPARPGRYSGVWIALGIAILALGGGLFATGRVPLEWLPGFVIVGLIPISLGVLLALVHVVGPDEALVISGRRHQVAGRIVNHRIVTDGRVVPLPIIERVDRISLRPMPFSIKVTPAYTKGGTPVSLEADGLVKISSHLPYLQNAVERFLGRSLDEVARVAREVVEGQTRSVLASLTLEEAQADQLKLAQVILEETDLDMDKLGLSIDTLSIRRIEAS